MPAVYRYSRPSSTDNDRVTGNDFASHHEKKPSTDQEKMQLAVAFVNSIMVDYEASLPDTYGEGMSVGLSKCRQARDDKRADIVSRYIL